ncbi:MAG: hypothetical protein LAT67_09570 [Balneolales bacterium]|nr:hypothetical protein [Balneolales bacterium]
MCLWSVSAFGQLSSIELSTRISGQAVTESLSVLKSGDSITADEAFEGLAKEGKSGSYYYGFVQNYIWIGLSLHNKDENTAWIIEIRNPNINFIEFYGRSYSDSLKLQTSTGRAAPMSSRNIRHTNFAFPIEVAAGETADVLFMLDKRRSSLQYPVSIWSEKEFYQRQQLNYAYYGLYFGAFIFVALISVIAYLVSFYTKILWYLLYMLSVGAFVFVDSGLAQKYLYPDSYTIGGHARIGISYVMLITLNLFVTSYFSTKALFTSIHRVIKVCSVVVASLAAFHLLFTGLAIQNATAMIFTLYSAILCSFGAAIIVAVRYYTVDKYSSLLFAGAFSFIFVAGILFICTEFGLLRLPSLLFTPIQIGSLFEIVFLSSGIVWQIRLAKKDHAKLVGKINRLENENLRAYIRGSEKERERVAMELHDEIGSRLSQISRNTASASSEPIDTQTEIQAVVQKVRLLSHKLSPFGLSVHGLTAALDQVVRQTNESSSVVYSFQAIDMPDDLPDDKAIQIFRIVQESIQNIEKHSKAKKAEIQLIRLDDEIVVTIEDDGVGILPEKNKSKGIGLYNIEKRVAYIGGRLSVTSQPGNGVEIMVTMPLTS